MSRRLTDKTNNCNSAEGTWFIQIDTCLSAGGTAFPWRRWAVSSPSPPPAAGPGTCSEEESEHVMHVDMYGCIYWQQAKEQKRARKTSKDRSAGEATTARQATSAGHRMPQGLRGVMHPCGERGPATQTPSIHMYIHTAGARKSRQCSPLPPEGWPQLRICKRHIITFQATCQSSHVCCRAAF